MAPRGAWLSQYNQFQAYMQVVDDLDYYSVQLVQGQRLHAWSIDALENAFLTCVPEIWYWTGSRWRYFMFIYTNVDFVAPQTGTYYFRIRPFAGSCIHLPYTLLVNGLSLPEPPPPEPPQALDPPVITSPQDDELVDPQGWKIAWDYDASKALQAAFQVQVAQDPEFCSIVLDTGEVTDQATYYRPDLYQCGDYYVRARIKAEGGPWTDWCAPVSLRLGLVRLEVVPDWYSASGLGLYQNAEFTYSVSGPCTVVAEIRIGDTPYYRRSVPGDPGLQSFAWPGFLIRLPENDLRVGAIVAPARQYTVALVATGSLATEITDQVEADFFVAWYQQ